MVPITMKLSTGIARLGRAAWEIRAEVPEPRAPFPTDTRMSELLQLVAGKDATLYVEVRADKACLVNAPADLSKDQLCAFTMLLAREMRAP